MDRRLSLCRTRVRCLAFRALLLAPTTSSLDPRAATALALESGEWRAEDRAVLKRGGLVGGDGGGMTSTIIRHKHRIPAR